MSSRREALSNWSSCVVSVLPGVIGRQSPSLRFDVPTCTVLRRLRQVGRRSPVGDVQNLIPERTNGRLCGTRTHGPSRCASPPVPVTCQMVKKLAELLRSTKRSKKRVSLCAGSQNTIKPKFGLCVMEQQGRYRQVACYPGNLKSWNHNLLMNDTVLPHFLQAFLQ